MFAQRSYSWQASVACQEYALPEFCSVRDGSNSFDISRTCSPFCLRFNYGCWLPAFFLWLWAAQCQRQFYNSLQQLAAPLWMGTAPGAFSLQLSPPCRPRAMLNLYFFLLQNEKSSSASQAGRSAGSCDASFRSGPKSTCLQCVSSQESILLLPACCPSCWGTY